MPGELLPGGVAVRCRLDIAEWPLLTGGNSSLTVDSATGSGVASAGTVVLLHPIL